MAFSIADWRRKLTERWREWAADPRGKLAALGANSLFYAIAGSALYPVAAALAHSDPNAAVQLLSSVATGAGVNLIANCIQDCADESDAARVLEAAATEHSEIASALDQILGEMDAFRQIQHELSTSDRTWFTQTLRQELPRLGSRFVIGGDGSVVIGGDVYGDVYLNAAPASTASKELRTSYFTWLTSHVRALPRAGVDPLSVSEDTRADLDLAAVYTALMTQSTERGGELDPQSRRELRRLSALEVLNAEPHLALLGDPGSGKSTFVNFVTLCMSGEILGRSAANINLLTSPLPEEDEDRLNREREEKPKPQPWSRGALLSARVILRDLGARGLPPVGHPADADTLWKFIHKELPETLSGFGELMRREWLQEGGLLLLDGLDEVPEADDRREQVKGAVKGFAAIFPKVRVLVTSRTYAYQKQAWKLEGFAEAVLAPFGRGQIRRFVERWYAYVGTVRGLPKDDAEGRAVQLNRAIDGSTRLAELASRPLLLTLMASLHAWRGGTLPEQREELYSEAVDLLLNQWESQKLRRMPDGTYEFLQPSLAEWLRVDRKKVRELLDRLAFEAHRDQPDFQGTADIAENKLVSQLMGLNLNPDARSARLVEYVSARAGLLEPRGVRVYAFPHRTFQEYLAACHLTGDSFPDEIAELARANPQRWREVALLAGAKAARGTAFAAWALSEALCFNDIRVSSDRAKESDPDLWGALLAAQVLIENSSLTSIAKHNQQKVERIRQWLTFIVTHGLLSPVDRARAGDAQAMIGDPRDLEELVVIPEGVFRMGSDKSADSLSWDDEEPQHEVFVPSFKIGKYPVTVAKWRQFVEDTRYQGYEKSIQGILNHPVVRVSWQDARAFCDWLTRLWRKAGKIGTNEIAGLPTEAEWEKAARGVDGRIWPWGNEFDSKLANTAETGLGGTCAVGCFPDGKSPYGILDMAGNVYEWCQSMRKPYPYKANDGRESLQGDDHRVMRGGAFYYSHERKGCSYRSNNHSFSRLSYLGFRVVVSPASRF
jgi:formylglycine-generating enzyme required for sulfatase activity